MRLHQLAQALADLAEELEHIRRKQYANAWAQKLGLIPRQDGVDTRHLCNSHPPHCDDEAATAVQIPARARMHNMWQHLPHGVFK